MAEAKELTEEEKDKQLQDEARKKSEDRVKLVDDIVKRLTDLLDKGVDQHGLQSILKEVGERIGKIQVIAAGMQIGPTEKEKEETKLPIIAPPMADGTPVANIAQAKGLEGEKNEAGKETATKPATSHSVKK